MSEKNDRDQRVPLRSDEQESPEPERPIKPQEEDDEGNPVLDKPSQAEGERELEE